MKKKSAKGGRVMEGQNPYKSDGHYFSGEIREVPAGLKLGKEKGIKNRVKFN